MANVECRLQAISCPCANAGVRDPVCGQPEHLKVVVVHEPTGVCSRNGQTLSVCKTYTYGLGSSLKAETDIPDGRSGARVCDGHRLSGVGEWGGNRKTCRRPRRIVGDSNSREYGTDRICDIDHATRCATGLRNFEDGPSGAKCRRIRQRHHGPGCICNFADGKCDVIRRLHDARAVIEGRLKSDGRFGSCANVGIGAAVGGHPKCHCRVVVDQPTFTSRGQTGRLRIRHLQTGRNGGPGEPQSETVSDNSTKVRDGERLGGIRNRGYRKGADGSGSCVCGCRDQDATRSGVRRVQAVPARRRNICDGDRVARRRSGHILCHLEYVVRRSVVL